MAESVVRDYRISIDEADTMESSKTGLRDLGKALMP